MSSEARIKVASQPSLGTAGGRGQYRILSKLGEGGCAVVYLALHRGPSGVDKLVAMKQLQLCFASDHHFREMFLEEAKLASRFSHPNVVHTFGVTEGNEFPLMVMEFLNGQPLSNVITMAEKSGVPDAWPLSMHVRVLRELLSGLHYAHEMADYRGRPLDLVHRDVSPQNVFITFDGHVKVLDFGIAKANSSMVQTRAGAIKGKLRYMSPEQVSGAPLDRRADLFSVGVMLWEALAGQRLWSELPDTCVADAILLGQIRPPSEVRPGIPPELELICLKALANDRDERFATAADLRDALDAFMHSHLVSERDLGELVSQLCHEQRERTRLLIESKVGEASLLVEKGGLPTPRARLAEPVAVPNSGREPLSETRALPSNSTPDPNSGSANFGSANFRSPGAAPPKVTKSSLRLLFLGVLLCVTGAIAIGAGMLFQSNRTPPLAPAAQLNAALPATATATTPPTESHAAPSSPIVQPIETNAPIPSSSVTPAARPNPQHSRIQKQVVISDFGGRR